MKLVYLDSCVLIYRVEGVESFKGIAEQALLSLGSAQAFVSPLVRMECLVKPLRLQDERLRLLYESLLSAFPLVGLPSPVFDLGTEIRAQHGLKTPDALHAACAIHHGCDEIWTHDDRLRCLGNRIRVKIIG